jgi:hypothetical protein
MDCEKFEAALMDELYGELDELTSAAMKRHASGCSRCAGLLSGLTATRRLSTIPVVEPPPGLEARILAAAAEAQKVVPIRRRLSSVVSLAGRWAMRPQTATAAVFLIMIGTSALFLTSKGSRAPASASVTVTEQGTPAAQFAPVASASAAPTPAPMAIPVMTPPAVAASALARADSPRDESLAHGSPAPKGFASPASPPAKDDDNLAMNATRAAAAPAPTAAAGPMGGAGGGDVGGIAAERKAMSPIASAIQLYQAGQYDDATRAFDALSPGDPSAVLWGARSVRESKGCRAALARFDQAAQRGASSPTGWDALLEGARCYRQLGDYGNARLRLAPLLKVDSHRDQAQAELDRMQPSSAGAGGAAKQAAPAPAPPPAARPPAPSVDVGY